MTDIPDKAVEAALAAVGHNPFMREAMRAALSAASPFMGALGVRNLVRPIVGIENRTAQEVFDIMSDRISSALIPAPVPQEAEPTLAELTTPQGPEFFARYAEAAPPARQDALREALEALRVDASLMYMAVEDNDPKAELLLRCKDIVRRIDAALAAVPATEAREGE